MNTQGVGIRDLAKRAYEFRLQERKLRNLLVKRWDELDFRTQQYWEELITLIVEQIPEPPREEDSGV